ncbi:hypothetical protein CO608_08430 [Lysobacteraceae bacterium NML08-0793]|nr:hypothetical protein CO608_08430 [Xanthomonadaceae bacterium NML08-0793]
MTSTIGETEIIEVKLLDFDPRNPRFYDGSGQDEESATQRMLEQENLEELVSSIGTQGFFPGEPLLITPNPDKLGRWIVVEGNRRLAALRVLSGLISPDRLPRTLADLVKQARHKPDEVACFEFPQRRDVLKYLGFRHISGPRRWEPLAKARYLADLIQNFYSQLSLQDQLRAVASDIGSRRDYVAQLLTALNLYDRARQQNFYGLQHVREEDIDFSLLSTALSYRNIVDFLNLRSRDAVDISGIDESHARDLLSWMFAQDQQGQTVLGESRRLKTLAAVVSSERALVELRKSGDLDKAYIFTSGPAESFLQLLSRVEDTLSQCIGMVSDDVAPDQSHVQHAKRIIDRAEDLNLLIESQIRRRERRARQAEQAEGHADA